MLFIYIIYYGIRFPKVILVKLWGVAEDLGLAGLYVRT